MQNELTLQETQGGKAEFSELFEAWFPKAYRAAKAVCGSRALAEDAVQEALIRFWRKMPGLKDPEAAEGYFLRIAVNEARRIRTRRKAEPEDAAIGVIEGNAASAEEEANSREQARALASAIGKLPVKLRIAVQLHYLGGFTEAKTAELLGTSLPSVKMRLSRARERLKQLLQQAGYDVIGG